MKSLLQNIDTNQLITQWITWISSRIFLILLGIFAFWIGLKIIKILNKYVDNVMKKSRFDKWLQYFLHNTISLLLKWLLIISVAMIMGVPASSFLAILWAAWLAIWLALQGSLSNFAGGVLILLFKPFKVGEYIEAQGISGTVEEINIFSSILTTAQHQMVSVPNGQLANGHIINYSRLKKRRIDIKIGIAYDADIATARKVLLPLLVDHPKILNEPAPQILVDSLWDNSVNLIMRGFLPTDVYRDYYYSLREDAKIALDNAWIEIPFPQRVIHMKKEE